MVNFYIYAKDFSGSTHYNKYFHTNGMKTLTEFKNDVEKAETELLIAGEPTESKIIYLHWGDTCYEVDEDITVIAYNNLESGHMGTQPATIIQWLKQNYDICNGNNQIRLLYIITDGLIYEMDASQCFEYNEDMHYKKVVFHAINENLNQIDLSVAASFFKSHCILYRNYELFDDVNISQELDYDKINADNFVTERVGLKSYIKLKFINKFKHDILALQEIDKLKKLRDRLFVEISAKSQNTKINLDTRDKHLFLRDFVSTDWYINLNAPEHGMKVEIEKSISTLINYIVSDTKSYSFDALKFDTQFNNSVEEEPIVDVDFADEQEIEFPDIILEDDKGIPVILLTECNLLDKIIFHKKTTSDAVSPASFNKFKSAMQCPLFLVKDSDIAESIGYFYTLKVYKQLLEKTTKNEPRTRRPYHGGIVLIDTNEFDKYNDYILSATYFNYKKVNYNIGLFYYVLLKNCDSKEWMNKNVVEQFKKYVMRRISMTVCKIGLSSLPLDPKENTSLLTALWYCVELSSCLFKDDPINFMHERLRMYSGVAFCMIEILQYFNYDLDLECIEKRRDMIRYVMILKKTPVLEAKSYYILENIFKNIKGFLVSEIESPSNLCKLNYLKLNHKGMLSDNEIEKPVHLNDYVHLMHTTKVEDGKDSPQICSKTFRPYFTINQNTSFYTELLKGTTKAIIKNDDDKNKLKITHDKIDSLEFGKIMSLYNLFIKCVQDFGEYPSFTDYLEYVHKKKKYHGNLITVFPINVYNSARKAYERYQNIVTSVDVKEFISVTKTYVNRSERIKAEGVLLNFNSDVYECDINNFIALEEKKVNLIKNVKEN